MRTGKFKSKLDGVSRSKRAHMCTECRHNQKQSWKDAACPNCGRHDTRQYFMSRIELERAAFLLLQRDLGKIRNLRFQPRFDINVSGRKICTYIADAQYVNDKGQTIIEDTKPKSFMDKTAELKIRLFEAVFNKTVNIYK